MEKYGLHVEVSDPVHDEGKVKTWKLKVQTRPERIRDLPAQRIHIDVCDIPSYQIRPMMILNSYGVEMGTSGLIIHVESREEIFADKLVAFALRSNRIKYRDLWDIMWLNQQSIKPQMDLIPKKLNDHHSDKEYFLELFNERLHMLQSEPKMAVEFRQEMHRFLPAHLVSQIVDQATFWTFLTGLMNDLGNQVTQILNDSSLGY